MVGDRDTVGGDKQADHDLRPIGTVVPAVAEGEGGEGSAPDGDRLEVARGEVVADETQIEVRQVAQLGVEMGLGGLLLLGKGIDRPVALIEAGSLHARGQSHGVEPLVDRAALGGGLCQAVGHHREHCVRKDPRAPAIAEGGEVLIEAEATEVRPDGRNRAEARRAEALELTCLEIGALGVSGQGLDDPVELSGLSQLCHLAQAKQRPLGELALAADGLDKGQVLVGRFAIALHRPLDEHTRILQDHKSQVVDYFATTLCPKYPYSGTICAGQELARSLRGSTRAKVRPDSPANRAVPRCPG